jgi:hypothetical protein
MPARSQAQQKAMAIALHAPEKLHARNRGLLKMPRASLRAFASTSRKGLPARKTQTSSLAHRLSALRGAGAFRSAR